MKWLPFIFGLGFYGFGIFLIVFSMWGMDFAMLHQETKTMIVLSGWTDNPKYVSPWEWFHVNLLQILPLGALSSWLGLSLLIYERCRR